MEVQLKVQNFCCPSHCPKPSIGLESALGRFWPLFEIPGLNHKKDHVIIHFTCLLWSFRPLVLLSWPVYPTPYDLDIAYSLIVQLLLSVEMEHLKILSLIPKHQ